jgi:hypothetical protein
MQGSVGIVNCLRESVNIRRLRGEDMLDYELACQVASRMPAEAIGHDSEARLTKSLPSDHVAIESRPS